MYAISAFSLGFFVVGMIICLIKHIMSKRRYYLKEIQERYCEIDNLKRRKDEIYKGLSDLYDSSQKRIEEISKLLFEKDKENHRLNIELANLKNPKTNKKYKIIDSWGREEIIKAYEYSVIDHHYLFYNKDGEQVAVFIDLKNIVIVK